MTQTPVERRKDLLARVEKIVCADRIAQYSDAEDNFRHIAARWTLYLRARGFLDDDFSISAMDVAVMMADVKISRIAHNINHQDSWDDLVGYGTCGGGMVNGER